jgi:uncharacterized protein (TIGR02145 family)
LEPKLKYDYGSQLRLLAIPAPGWEFQSWNINGTSTTNNPLVYEILDPTNVSITFKRREYELDLFVDGEGSVAKEVLVQPVRYSYETQLKLSAIPAPGWEFIEWSGDMYSTENPFIVNVEEDIQLTAKFSRRKFELSIQIEGEGGVIEEVLIPQGQFEFQTNLKLTAVAKDNWVFSKWGGDLSGNTNPLELILIKDYNISAEFVELFDLNADILGEGTVEFELIEGIKSGNKFSKGSKIRVKAIPDINWHFQYWGENEDNSENEIIIELFDDTLIKANFLEEFSLSVDKDNGGSYELSVENGNPQIPLLDGNVIRLTANYEDNYLFYGWGGDVTSENKTISLTVQKDISLNLIQRDIDEVVRFNSVEISDLYSSSAKLSAERVVLDNTYPIVEWGVRVSELNGSFEKLYSTSTAVNTISIEDLPSHHTNYNYSLTLKIRDQLFYRNPGQFKTTFYKPSSSLISDIEGNNYEVVVLGNQEWTLSNLNVTKFRNGDPLVTHTSLEDFSNNYDWSKPTYIDVEFNSENSVQYGRLYNLRALTDPRTLAPEGTRIPTYVDINDLLNWMVDKTLTSRVYDVGQYFKHPEGGFGASLKTNETNLGFKGIGQSNESFRLALQSVWSQATQEAYNIRFSEENNIIYEQSQDFWSSKNQATRLQLINPYSYRSFYFVRLIKN